MSVYYCVLLRIFLNQLYYVYRIDTGVSTGSIDLNSSYDKCAGNFNLRDIPEGVIEALDTRNIKELWMGGNSLYTFPLSICNSKGATSMTTLSLARNHLHDLPQEIGLLLNLERLILSHNKIALVSETSFFYVDKKKIFAYLKIMYL